MMNSTMDDEFYDRLMNILMTLTLAVICVLGLIGNAIVLLVGFYKRKYQNNVTNCYIMNLSMTDFLFLLISVPLTMYLGMGRMWVFGNFLCKINIYLAHVFLHATCYTLAAMSIDRYLHIVHGQWYRRFRTPRLAQIICLLIWTVSAVLMFPYEHLFGVHSTKSNNTRSQEDCTVQDKNSSSTSCLLTFLVYYIFPLFIIGLSYLSVSIHLRRTGYCMVKRLSGVSRQSIQIRRRRVQRMLLGLILAFALCWLPIHCLELLNCTGLTTRLFSPDYSRIWNGARMIAHAFSYSNSCLNPILYALLNNGYFSSDH